MNISTLAFRTEIPDWTTMSDFSKFLVAKNCIPFGRDENQILAVKRDTLVIGKAKVSVLVGILIRTKDSRTLTTMEEGGQKFSVSTEELKAGTSLVDFNHFIVNEKNGMGLYQAYHHSVTLPTFTKVLGKKFHSFEGLAKYKNTNKSNSETFRCEQYLTRDALSKMVEQMSKISKIEYKLVTGTVDRIFGVANNEIKYTRKVIAYNPKTTTLDLIKRKIKSALNLKSKDIEQIWVHGASENGEDKNSIYAIRIYVLGFTNILYVLCCNKDSE